MNLKPGQSIKISESNGVVCTMERSGNGEVIRYVRTFADGSWEVFKTIRA
jgi:cell envelope opacity-associated protein A